MTDSTVSQSGSDNEILLRLGDFGLGAEHGRAVCSDGLQNMELHREWLEKRREIEQEGETLRERVSQPEAQQEAPIDP
jgi:hypothetical protein